MKILIIHNNIGMLEFYHLVVVQLPFFFLGLLDFREEVWTLLESENRKFISIYVILEP